MYQTPTVLKFIGFFLLSRLALAVEPCRIEIIDKGNGWPVPLVELTSTHETRHVSDNLGLIAIQDPDLLGREIWFHVKGHGYGVTKNRFDHNQILYRLDLNDPKLTRNF